MFIPKRSYRPYRQNQVFSLFVLESPSGKTGGSSSILFRVYSICFPWVQVPIMLKVSIFIFGILVIDC